MQRIFLRKAAILFALTTCFFAMPAQADFPLGVQYYEQSNFEKAYREFSQAAKYGDYAAQFNLGVMYYRGEFVQKDTTTGYAWLALAAQDKEYSEKSLHQKIYDKFTDEEKKKADSIYIELFDQYSDAAIQKNLIPVYTGGSPLSKRLRVLKQVLPEYPFSALRNAGSGWVDVFFTVDKDGTTRDHVVQYSSGNYFTTAVIDALRGWQYEPTIIGGRAVAVNGVQLRFIFRLDGETFSEGKITKLMTELRGKAVSGDPSAKYAYAYFLDALPSYTHYTPVADSNENPNKWYLAAANSGSAISSFSLGRNILNGDMCTADGNKSMGWLLKAASQNVIDAQYLLALELFSGARLEKNEEQAMYWLRRAADHSSRGSMAAKLRYAGILATNPDKDQRNGKLATTYLNQVNEEYPDKQTYYQVSAAVFAENGDFDAAVKWQIKAQKDAQKLNLPEQKINERLEAYSNRKAWRETP